MKFSFGLSSLAKASPEVERQREEAEERIRVLSDERRNQQQALQSGGRRLRTMARTMALLRDGIDG